MSESEVPIEEVVAALADSLRDALMRGESVQVPGLGTFSVRHHTSKAVQDEQGNLVMTPPRDEIIFTPESDGQG